MLSTEKSYVSEASRIFPCFVIEKSLPKWYTDEITVTAVGIYPPKRRYYESCKEQTCAVSARVLEIP